MPAKKISDADRAIELLEKMLVMQMHGMGATQDQIARTVGKQKLWVNNLVKKMPRSRQP